MGDMVIWQAGMKIAEDRVWNSKVVVCDAVTINIRRIWKVFCSERGGAD